MNPTATPLGMLDYAGPQPPTPQSFLASTLRVARELRKAKCDLVLDLEFFAKFPLVLSSMAGIEAIFLTLFVLASQKRLTAAADRRAHLDLQVNLLAEQEMTLVLQMLREICTHLGLHGTIESEKFKELARRTDVSQLAEQVERRHERS